MTNPVVEFRKKAKITRKTLAQRTGISYATLSCVECGLVNKLQKKTAQAISEFAKTPTEEVERSYKVWKESLKQAA